MVGVEVGIEWGFCCPFPDFFQVLSWAFLNVGSLSLMGQIWELFELEGASHSG